MIRNKQEYEILFHRAQRLERELEDEKQKHGQNPFSEEESALMIKHYIESLNSLRLDLAEFRKSTGRGIDKFRGE
jgi:hypothetical protein